MYEEICSLKNLLLAFKKAKKGKNKKRYVKRFQKDLGRNLINLRSVLISRTYLPYNLRRKIIRDPKTRKISISAFRDRVVHHALCNIISPLFEENFIYDSHANQIGKGTFRAIKRFDSFKRKLSKNNSRNCFILKADIKHYFEEIDHKILLDIIQRKIKCEKTIWLIKQIMQNKVERERERERERDADSSIISKGMPLGNLTSQFFANVYLNELDQFVKHKLKAKYYIRYVDDFVIFYTSKKQLEIWKKEIKLFLYEKLMLELHPDKSKIYNLNEGINFLGFRIFYDYKLIKKSNLKNFERKFNQTRLLFKTGILEKEKIFDSLEGWLAYCSHANTFKYRNSLIKIFENQFQLSKKQINSTKQRNFLKKLENVRFEFSTQKTLCLFKRGLNIRQIAQMNFIKESTVWKHIINLVEHNQLSPLEILSKEKIYKIVSKIKSKKDSLKIIKSRIKDNSITYDEIACVMLGIRNRCKKF